jgi:hypothetical protein
MIFLLSATTSTELIQIETMLEERLNGHRLRNRGRSILSDSSNGVQNS